MEKRGSNAQSPTRALAPQLSVIVPVRNGARFLEESLAALRASDFPPDRWELLVVDDASTDGSAGVAARYADRVVRLERAAGPAAARNLGARRASGQVLVFIDADVSVHRDVLQRFDDVLRDEPGIAAAFGAYDTRPRAPGLVSQYRNLLHHRVHAESPGDAETFWAGCGAVRRDVFAKAGEFDETMRQLEDIDLGYRVRALGHRIVLQPDIQGTHLKRWTLRSMVATDLFGRGMTWTRLYLERRNRDRLDTLNIRRAEKVYTLLAALALASLALAGLRREATWLIAALLCVLVVLLGNVPLFRWFAHERGVRFTLGVVPLRLLYYLVNAAAVTLALAGHLLPPRRRAPQRPTDGTGSDQPSS